MAASVPWNVIVVVAGAVADGEGEAGEGGQGQVPWVAESVTSYTPAGARVASTSAIERPVMAASTLSSLTEAFAGTAPVTGSLTAVTVTLTVAVSVFPLPSLIV